MSSLSSSRLRSSPPARGLADVPVEILLAHAEQELSMGSLGVDSILAQRLEDIAKDRALPRATRAHALLLLCRMT
jgi:hypothetical protein